MAEAAGPARHPARPGRVGRVLGAVARALGWLVAALVFSVAMEWVGMAVWWEDEGRLHSRGMLEREIGYLNEDFRASVVVSDPARLARGFADGFYRYLFQWTGVERLVAWLGRPSVDGEGRWVAALRAGYARVAEYVIAAMTVTQVFAVRLAVLTLAMPVFVLVGLVALVDGLVQRDLRRWCGGRESAFVYHHAKKAVGPALGLAWVVYLGMPVSVHPSYVVLPFAGLFGVGVAVTAGSFKKYL